MEYNISIATSIKNKFYKLDESSKSYCLFAPVYQLFMKIYFRTYTYIYLRTYTYIYVRTYTYIIISCRVLLVKITLVYLQHFELPNIFPTLNFIYLHCSFLYAFNNVRQFFAHTVIAQRYWIYLFITNKNSHEQTIPVINTFRQYLL